jgi:hypothetical protein
VVEIDGERAFVYYIDEAALLRKLDQLESGSASPNQVRNRRHAR